MHIKYKWAALLMLLPVCLAIGHPDALCVGMPETDPDLFAACLEIVGYSVPEGYALEGFSRADFNGDGATDMISTLYQMSGTGRLLLLIMSGSSGYLATENSVALPESSNGADDFLGLEAGENFISLYTSGSDGKRQEYRFTRDGEQFRLNTMTSLTWDDQTGDAIQERFDFFAGDYSMTFGKVSSNAYLPTGESVSHKFAGYSFSPELKEFDIRQTPKTWDGLEPIVGGSQDEEMAESAATPISASATLVPMVYCGACGNWYVEGEAFRNHVCTAADETAALKCKSCGLGFATLEALAGHVCSASKAPATVQCKVCGLWYLEGAEFRNHICVSYPATNLVFCDVCGGRFEEGEAFRTHVCKPLGTSEIPPTKPGSTASPPPPQTAHPTPSHGGPLAGPAGITGPAAPASDAPEPNSP